MMRGVVGLLLSSMLIMGANTPPNLANMPHTPIPVCLEVQRQQKSQECTFAESLDEFQTPVSLTLPQLGITQQCIRR